MGKGEGGDEGLAVPRVEGGEFLRVPAVAIATDDSPSHNQSPEPGAFVSRPG